MDAMKLSRGDGRRSAHLRGLLLSTTILGAATALTPSAANAACSPPAGGAGVPPSGTTVTCTGTTTNQNGIHGYGTGAETGLTINVESGATVTGTGSISSNGIFGGANTTVNVFGTVQGDRAAVRVSGSTSSVTNSGVITGINSNLSIGVFLLDNATATNLAGGIIGTNDSASGVFGGYMLTNHGTIRGYRGTTYVLNVINFGTIRGPNVDLGGSVGIGVDMRNPNSSLINHADATVSGYWGVVADNGTSIFNAGTITGDTGPAILFTGGNNILTIAPTSVINGVARDFGGLQTNIFQLGGTGTGTFDVSEIGPAAKYQAFGTFNKVDSSTWTLTGTGTQTWNVNSGTLLVNGTIGGAVVNSGGTLGGTGFAGTTTVNAGGNLSPGNSIGIFNVTGNLSFVGAGNYIVEVSPTAADLTNVSGTAALSGTLRAIGTGGTYVLGTRYTVLNATGGVSGTFGNLAVSGNFGTARPIIEYDANNVYLTLVQGSITPFLTGGTPNQIATAGAIDAALLNGNQAAPFLALFPLSGTQLANALDQLSGEVHVSTAGVLADESLYARSAILGRLRQASYGGNAQMAALTTGGPPAFAADGTAFDSALAFAKSPIVRKAPMLAPKPQSDVVFWAQGFGAWGRFDADGNAATVRRDLAGFITGLDTRAGDAGRIGIAAGYIGSKNNTDDRGTATVESGHIATYGGWSFGAWNLRAGGAYAFHNIDTDRTVNFPGFTDRLTARYDGGTGQIFGELGYGMSFGNVAVEPFAGAAWVRVKTDAAAERGGAAALGFAGTTFETGYTTLGIRAASMVLIGHDMVLIPRAALAWQHTLGSTTPSGVLTFQAAPVSFVIAGVPIARDSLLAEAGLDLAIGRNATVGVSYTGEVARNVSDHAAKGKFSWKF